MTSYRRGVYREMQTAAALMDDGYMVLTSRGSHGVADLVAIKLGQVLAVQVKTGDAELRDTWFNELFAVATEHGAIPIIADWPKRGTLRLRRITGRHAPRSPRWPVEPFTTDEIAERADPEGGE
jgi:Holliday junction resolvase